MSTKLKIKITKDILERSKNCFTDPSQNCAFALAIRDLFPFARVGGEEIFLVYDDKSVKHPHRAIPNTEEMISFIRAFDKMSSYQRTMLPEQEFELNIPDWALEAVNIEEIKPLLINHPTLELC